jgi:starch synthase
MLEKTELKVLKRVNSRTKRHYVLLFNLDPKKPLFSFIGRLLEEKGGDLCHRHRLLLSEIIKKSTFLF